MRALMAILWSQVEYRALADISLHGSPVIIGYSPGLSRKPLGTKKRSANSNTP